MTSTLSEKLRTSLSLTAALGSPSKIHEWENHVVLDFAGGASARLYFHPNGKLDEIQLVDCDLPHEKVTHRYRSTRP